MRHLLLILTLLIAISSRSQKTEMDSLVNVAETSNDMEEVVNSVYYVMDYLAYMDPEQLAKLCDKAEGLAEEAGDSLMLSRAWIARAKYLVRNQWYVDARGVLMKAVKYLEKSDQPRLLAVCYQSIGTTHRHSGKYEDAIDYFLKSSSIGIELGDQRMLAGSFNNLGIIYHYQKQPKKSQEYFEKAMAVFVEAGSKVNEAKIRNNLAISYREAGDIQRALEYFEISKKIWIELGDDRSLATAIHNQGVTFAAMDEMDKAKISYDQAISMQKRFNDEKGLTESYLAMAQYYEKLEQFDEGLKYSTLAMGLANKLQLTFLLSQIYSTQANLYEKKNEFENALVFHKMHVALLDSVQKVSDGKTIENLEVQFLHEKEHLKLELALDSARHEKEIAQHEIELGEEKAKRRDEELERKEVEQYFSIGGIILLLLFAIFIWSRFRITNRQKKVIEEQKDIVEEKNKEVLDSINYAQRLQQTILPSDGEVSRALGESFVFFLPKDIVSGDFYWLQELGDSVLFTVADCTGHGVPGAMVSVVGHNSLNRCVRELNITEPAAILDKLNELVKEAFTKEGQELKDGMDLAICRLDRQTKTLHYSGANNPLWIFGKDGFNMVKGDKQPIGNYAGESRPFTNHSIQLNAGDTIYLFSDGYADQFGGQDFKKLKLASMRDKLAEWVELPLVEQKTKLENFFHEWRGDVEQVDDVCVIGVRV